MKHLLVLSIFMVGMAAQAANFEVYEPLLGYMPTNNGIVFQVFSGGCTDRDDFTIDSQTEPATGIVYLTLERTRIDPCKAHFPMGVRIFYSYRELGFKQGQRYVISNQNGIVRSWLWN